MSGGTVAAPVYLVQRRLQHIDLHGESVCLAIVKLRVPLCFFFPRAILNVFRGTAAAAEQCWNQSISADD